VQFSISSNGPISNSSDYTKVLGDLPSLFADKHLSNVTNFKYLPPINRLEDASIDKSDTDLLTQYEIGNYARLGEYDKYTIEDLEGDLKVVEEKGYKKTISFDPTSFNNKLVTQFFEISQTEIKKLDVIDYGKHKISGVVKHVFFVGKIFIDDYGTDTFIKLFTLVFE